MWGVLCGYLLCDLLHRVGGSAEVAASSGVNCCLLPQLDEGAALLICQWMPEHGMGGSVWDSAHGEASACGIVIGQPVPTTWQRCYWIVGVRCIVGVYLWYADQVFLHAAGLEALWSRFCTLVAAKEIK